MTRLRRLNSNCKGCPYDVAEKEIQCPACGQQASVIGWQDEAMQITVQVTCEWCDWEGFEVNVPPIPLTEVKKQRAVFEARLRAMR